MSFLALAGENRWISISCFLFGMWMLTIMLLEIKTRRLNRLNLKKSKGGKKNE